MKKLILTLSLAVAVFAFSGCRQKDAGGNSGSNDSLPTEIAPAGSEADAADGLPVEGEVRTRIPDGVKLEQTDFKSLNGRPMVVDFSAPWCPPCRAMAPVFESAADEFGDSINFVTIDADEYTKLASTYNVSSIPCIVFLDSSGRELYRQVGAVNMAQLKSLLNKHFSSYMPH